MKKKPVKLVHPAESFLGLARLKLISFVLTVSSFTSKANAQKRVRTRARECVKLAAPAKCARAADLSFDVSGKKT